VALLYPSYHLNLQLPQQLLHLLCSPYLLLLLLLLPRSGQLLLLGPLPLLLRPRLLLLVLCLRLLCLRLQVALVPLLLLLGCAAC
jgi:hypothetical protein